jgi:hypothetical protein
MWIKGHMHLNLMTYQAIWRMGINNIFTQDEVHPESKGSHQRGSGSKEQPGLGILIGRMSEGAQYGMTLKPTIKGVKDGEDLRQGWKE